MRIPPKPTSTQDVFVHTYPHQRLLGVDAFGHRVAVKLLAFYKPTNGPPLADVEAAILVHEVLGMGGIEARGAILVIAVLGIGRIDVRIVRVLRGMGGIDVRKAILVRICLGMARTEACN